MRKVSRLSSHYRRLLTCFCEIISVAKTGNS